MHTTARKRIRTAAAAVSLGLLALLPVRAAEASSSYTLYSSDDHAKAKITVTWKSQTRVYVAWQNFDLKADGKGAIMDLTSQYKWNGLDGGNYVIRYDHVLSGAGTSDLSTEDWQQSQVIDHLELDECNGGSSVNRYNCDVINIANPYK